MFVPGVSPTTAPLGRPPANPNVPTTGPAVAVLVRPDAVLVAGTGRAVWLGKK
jgi:hypothetical protein